MSEQPLNLENDWEEVKEIFRNHFNSKNVEVRENEIKYSKRNEHLIIKKDGQVSGGMPLHETSFSGIKDIVFRESEIELKSEDFSYTFRR